MLGGFARAPDAPERGMREAYAGTADGAPWRRLPDMSHPRAFFGSVAVDGGVVALGAGGAEEYIAEESRWRPVALDGPLPVSHFGIASSGRRAWVVGGFPVEAGAARTVDLATGHVSLLPPLPGFAPGDHFHAVAMLDGELHVVGGLGGDPPLPRRDHWVLRQDAWVALPEAPVPVWMKFGCLAVVERELFIFTRECALAYDAAGGTWRSVAPLEPATVMPAAVVTGGTIEVLGGTTLDGRPLPVRRYRPSEDRWEVISPGEPAPPDAR